MMVINMILRYNIKYHYIYLYIAWTRCIEF